MMVSQQTKRNRVAAGRKAAAVSKARREAMERSAKPWPAMTKCERSAALKQALADGAPIDPGIERGSARGDYAPGELIASIHASVAKIRSREAAQPGQPPAMAEKSA